MRNTSRLVFSVLILLAFLAGAGCSNRDYPCGNGLLESFEACDGDALRNETCLSLGYYSGQLACRDNCTLDTSGCSQIKICEPACDLSLCETCINGTCISYCRAGEVCEAGTCSVEGIPLRLFFTADEHGWLFSGWSDDGTVFYGGAAELMTLMRERGYDPNENNSLLLSDGDMWTGPAISTWYKGESVVEVMNAMGYSAAAIGNHEFDFGQDVLLQRSQEADFPFLAANLRDEVSGDPPAYARNYIVEEVNGVQVGIIGLTLDGLPYLVCSDNLEGLVETGYEQALRETVPLARADGAQVVIVISHICPDDLMELTWLAAELDIDLMTAGHCHSTSVDERYGVLVVSPGASMVKFAQVDMIVNPVTYEVVFKEAEVVENYYYAPDPVVPDPDPAIQSIVDFWLEQVEQDLGEVIGYTQTGIDGWAMYNMTVDSFLMALPEADLAVVNTTGFRSSYSPGDITIAHTVSVQPFENYLVVLELTGAQIVQAFEYFYWPQALAGALVDKSGARTIVSINGGPINPASTYRLVTIDYLLCQPDYFPFDVPPESVTFTDLHWRQTTEDWIRAQESAGDDPLEDFLDPTPRWVD